MFPEISGEAVAVFPEISGEAVAVFPEISGEAVGAALDAAGPPDDRGWRELTLAFEHEPAAAHRLAGLGDRVEVRPRRRCGAGW